MKHGKVKPHVFVDEFGEPDPDFARRIEWATVCTRSMVNGANVMVVNPAPPTVTGIEPVPRIDVRAPLPEELGPLVIFYCCCGRPRRLNPDGFGTVICDLCDTRLQW